MIAKELFEEFNNTVFEGALPADLSITFNVRLLKTAGKTRMLQNRATMQRFAKIEIATKVSQVFLLVITTTI